MMQWCKSGSRFNQPILFDLIFGMSQRDNVFNIFCNQVGLDSECIYQSYLIGTWLPIVQSMWPSMLGSSLYCIALWIRFIGLRLLQMSCGYMVKNSAADHAALGADILDILTLKTDYCPDANFVVTDGGRGGLHDNLCRHQWRQSWHHDVSRFSMNHCCSLIYTYMTTLWKHCVV